MLDKQLLEELQQFIDKYYKPPKTFKSKLRDKFLDSFASADISFEIDEEECNKSYDIPIEEAAKSIKHNIKREECIEPELSISCSLPIDFVLDESFSESLLKLIDAKGISDVECYSKANIDRRLFSKIRSDKYYRPSKSTVLLFCIALELNITETNKLLKKAGFVLSRSFKSDCIVEFFIRKKIYDIMAIDDVLLQNDQKTLSNY